MHIFLDSNVFWKDPFLTKGKNAILLRLAKHDDVKIYINETVYAEVFRGHRVFLENELKTIIDSFKKIKPFINTNRDKEPKIDINNLINDFHENFQELIDEEQLEIIKYDSKVLTHLVDVDLNLQPPFLKKQEIMNKNDTKTTYIKKEIRDAIIWYSYIEYIKQNNLVDCYFISNNTEDFGNGIKSKNIPEGEPYDLDATILENMKIVAYKNVHDFLMHNVTAVKSLFKDEYLHTRLLSMDFSEQIKKELKDGLAEEIVSKYLIEQITDETHNILSDMQPDDIHSDYFMDGYVDPQYTGEITKISLNDFDIYGEMISISVDVDIEFDVDVYLYNPGYDSREEKYICESTDRVKLEESIVFLMSIDTEKELDKENFSFEEYIMGIEPDNLNIEVIKKTNIHHISMFEEEEEEDDA